jgi:mannose-6-phosphate isomerase-like protein (cupin superfamily)
VRGGRNLHAHQQPEIYFIIEGTGILTIDGRGTPVTGGSTPFYAG